MAADGDLQVEGGSSARPVGEEGRGKAAAAPAHPELRKRWCSARALSSLLAQCWLCLSRLCNFRPVTWVLRTSVVPPVKWGDARFLTEAILPPLVAAGKWFWGEAFFLSVTGCCWHLVVGAGGAPAPQNGPSTMSAVPWGSLRGAQGVEEPCSVPSEDEAQSQLSGGGAVETLASRWPQRRAGETRGRAGGRKLRPGGRGQCWGCHSQPFLL